MANDNGLDNGSDLSDLSDTGSGPATPGAPITPQTSPQHTTSAALHADDESHVAAMPPAPSQPPPVRRTSLRNKEQQHSSNTITTSGSQRSNGGPGSGAEAQGTRRAKGGYEYTNEPHRNVFRDTAVLDGKRTRKKAPQYEANGEASHQNNFRRSSSARTSNSRDRDNEADNNETKRVKQQPSETTPTIAEQSKAQSQPKSLRIKLKRKLSVTASPQDEDDSTRNVDLAQQQDIEMTAAEDDDEEKVVKSSRRKRKSLAAETEDTVGARVELIPPGDDEPAAVSENKAPLRRTRRGKHGNKRRRKSRDAPSRLSLRGKADDQDASDYEDQDGESSDEEPLSEDADVDKVQHSRRKDSNHHRSNNKDELVRKVSHPKGTAASGSSVPAKDLSKSAPSVSKSSSNAVSEPLSRSVPTALPNTSTPQRPPKSIVRKSTGSSVLANLMGYGGSGPGLRDNTPSRNVTPRPRPPGQPLHLAGTGDGGGSATRAHSITSSPQPSQLHKRNSESSTSSSGATTAARGSATVGTAVVGAIAAGKENPGLTGKHVTAEQMCALHDEEVHAYAHPTGLFDLLHGAELMMEFEEETRQRLAFDPFLHKYKLYRPGRTEGMWRLVERIKENEGRKAEC